MGTKGIWALLKINVCLVNWHITIYLEKWNYKSQIGGRILPCHFSFCQILGQHMTEYIQLVIDNRASLVPQE